MAQNLFRSMDAGSSVAIGRSRSMADGVEPAPKPKEEAKVHQMRLAQMGTSVFGKQDGKKPMAKVSEL